MTIKPLPPARFCACGDVLRDSQGDYCDSYECERYALGWGVLELQREPSGWRHFLHGEPVSCGTGLLLECARVDAGIEEGDGEYRQREKLEAAAKLREQRKEPLRVRYEAELWWPEDRKPLALLHVDVGGWQAVINGHSGMRVRFTPKYGRRWRLT